MNVAKMKKNIPIFFSVFWIFALAVYVIAFDQFRFESVSGTCPNPDFVVGEITDGTVVTQKLVSPLEMLENIDIYLGTFGKTSKGTLEISIRDEMDVLLTKDSIDLSKITSDGFFTVSLGEGLSLQKGQRLDVVIQTYGVETGKPITIYAGDAFREGTYKYQLNGESGVGSLCIKLRGYDYIIFYKIYWLLIGGVSLFIAAVFLFSYKKMKDGKTTILSTIIAIHYKYKFLLKQLVARDFKTKYKRSLLGMAWSLLNPLLTMSVQYVVFSSLFKSTTANYPIYLLTGIVFFNFFSEAVSMGMMSITQNAALIKKVYMPKYIYPFARILSSLINLVLALIPLMILLIVTKTPIRPAALLLIYDIVCLFLFVFGVILILSTAMTFFQDTQFLWGVISMMWQFLTPIFYNEAIIPERFLGIYRLNPMYQYISFARICLIEGISPPPTTYIYCLLFSVITLSLGVAIFKKYQDKFILYL